MKSNRCNIYLIRYIFYSLIFFSLFPVCLSAQSVTFNNTNTGATGTIQTWTVPPCVTTVTIEAWGAQGGGGNAGPGGLGARMKGDFSVTPGQVLRILVGQMGTQCGTEGGGGGGTFVTDNSNTPLIIAGGGGGSARGSVGLGGTTNTCGLDGQDPGAGFSTGGCAGNGGGVTSGCASGGGLLTNGGSNGSSSPCTSAPGGGMSFVNGGNGGTANCSFCNGVNADGGFGGGGATFGAADRGGGGGYSGGGAGAGSNGTEGGGGGGGSYNNGTNQSNASAEHEGHGLVQITWNTAVYYYTGSAQTFTVPPNITSITVEAWGAGGGGYSGGGGGGAGGGYGKDVVTVIPGNTYSVVVGQGGVHNVGDNDSCRAGSGGASNFGNGLVVATGGQGGKKSDSNPCSAPGIAAGGTSTATVNVNGGDGASAPASQCCPGTGGNGGGPGGGLGGGPDMPGNFPGGGAGGGSNNILAKDGADGFIKITWSYDTITLTGDTVICYGEYATLTASGGVSYLWNTGDTTSVIVVSPATTATYTLIATNNGGCTDTLTINVIVNAMPVANFTQSNVCLGAVTNFTDLSSVAPPASIISYEWDFGDGSAYSSVQNPSHTYASAGIFNISLVAATAYCVDTMLSQVAVYDAPVSGFTALNGCLNDSTHFTNTTVPPSINGIATWIWDFGDGSIPDATSWEPGHLYSFPGSYTVTLIVNSTYGCADTSVTAVSIYSNPAAGFASSEACLNQATAFNDLTAGTIASWSWDFGDASPVNTTQNPNHIYAIEGTYQASLIVVDNNGCRDTVIQSVVAHPLPDAQFSVANSCEGAFVQFTSQSTIASPDVIQVWSWNFGDGTTVNNQNTSHLYSASGSYNVQLNVVSGFGCEDSVSRTITLNPRPEVNFTALDTMGCAPLCTSFLSVVTNGTVQWDWDFGDGTSGSNQQNPAHCYDNTSPGSSDYSVSLAVTSDSGCTTTIIMGDYITVFPKPLAVITAAEYTIQKGSSTQLTATGGSTFQWSPATSLSCADCDGPVASPQQTTLYCVEVADSNNCIDSACITIEVVTPCSDLTVPTAFSPNGDGYNDKFYLQGWNSCIIEFSFMIFDRWGEKVFQANDGNQSWDGTFNGKAMDPAVFVYYLNATLNNGEKVTKKGNITLIK